MQRFLQATTLVAALAAPLATAADEVGSLLDTATGQAIGRYRAFSNDRGGYVVEALLRDGTLMTAVRQGKDARGVQWYSYTQWREGAGGQPDPVSSGWFSQNVLQSSGEHQAYLRTHGAGQWTTRLRWVRSGGAGGPAEAASQGSARRPSARRSSRSGNDNTWTLEVKVDGRAWGGIEIDCTRNGQDDIDRRFEITGNVVDVWIGDKHGLCGLRDVRVPGVFSVKIQTLNGRVLEDRTFEGNSGDLRHRAGTLRYTITRHRPGQAHPPAQEAEAHRRLEPPRHKENRGEEGRSAPKTARDHARLESDRDNEVYLRNTHESRTIRVTVETSQRGWNDADWTKVYRVRPGERVAVGKSESSGVRGTDRYWHRIVGASYE